MKNMKRYLAFFGNIYYPQEGMKDFIGDFDTVEEAKMHIKTVYENKIGFIDGLLPIEDDDSDHWAHIYDTHTNKIVYETNR